MRAVYPSYNNNEEIRYENKIKKNKNHKNDLLRIIINDDDDNYDSCYDDGKFNYVINASSLSSSSSSSSSSIDRHHEKHQHRYNQYHHYYNCRQDHHKYY